MSDTYGSGTEDDFDDIEDPADELDEDDAPEPEDTEDEPSDEDEPVEAQPARQASRGENRVATAAKIAAEAKREAAELRARIAAMEAAQSQPARESQAQRQERLAQMEPWERTEYLTNERLAAIEWSANERADKMAFQLTCQMDPVANKLKDEVERELAALRARGQNVDRDTMLTFLLGQRARANASRATGRTKKVATNRREQQAARPGAARSDAALSGQRGATAAARDKRLSDIQI